MPAIRSLCGLDSKAVTPPQKEYASQSGAVLLSEQHRFSYIRAAGAARIYDWIFFGDTRVFYVLPFFFRHTGHPLPSVR